MSQKMIEPRRGALTGFKGELTVSDDCQTVYVHDGETTGGIPLNRGPRTLVLSTVPASVTGTAVETTLATIVVPAGAIAPGGRGRIRTWWNATANANSRNMRIRAGSTSLSSGTLTSAYAMLDSDFLNIGNGSIAYVQSFLSGGSAGVAGATGSVSNPFDLSAAQVITVTGQLTVTTDTLTLFGYCMEILNP